VSASRTPTHHPTTARAKPKKKPTHRPPTVKPTPAVLSPTTQAGFTPTTPPVTPTTAPPVTPTTAPPVTHTTSAAPGPQSIGGYSGASDYGCSGPEPSGSGSAVSFTFINNSSSPISIAKYSTGGAYIGEGSVSAGGSAGFSTSTDSYWQVNNAGGGCMGEFNVYGSGSVTVVS
jgi:hypothetical protein